MTVLENLNETTAIAGISAVRGHAQALKFVAMGGSELNSMLSAIADAKSVERQGPVEICRFLVDHFVDEEGVHSIPVPGSKKGETGNKPYDKYSTKTKGADGVEKMVPGSFFTDVIKNTAEAKAIGERLEVCDGGEHSPKDIQDMSPGERSMEKKRLRQRLTDMRTALVKGTGVFLHADAINDINPDRIKVKMPWKTVDGKKRIYANTIRLQDPAGEIEDKVFTVSEFLRIDLAKLVGPGKDQTITTVENTKARPPKSDKNKGKGKNDIVVPTTVEGLLNLFNVAGTAMDQQTDEGSKTMAKLLAKLSAPGKEGDDAVETVGDFICALDDNIWTVINARYNAIKTAKAKASNVAAALPDNVKRANV
jgi:hypothetical protein